MSAAGPAQPSALPDGEALTSPDDVAPPEAGLTETGPAETGLSETEVTEDAPDAEDAPDEEYDDGDYADDYEYEYDDWDYERQPVSKLAVAALISGLLALLPLALGFGIAALAVIRRTGRRGSKMAVAGIYAAWIWVLAAGAVVVLAHFTHNFHSRVQIEYHPAAAYDLQPGDCLNGNPDGGSFSVISCSATHEAEVYGRFSLTGRTYPGATAVRQKVVDGCATLLTQYVDPQLANIGFSQQYMYPDKQAWAAGERTVICDARFTSGSMSGSIHKAS